MNVVLSPESEELVREKVASGRYQDAGAVLEEALLVLDERDRIAAMRAALDVAEEAVARGEVIRYTPELMGELLNEAKQMAGEGQLPDPDVCP
jgi:antitoxin ParD1/3/4